MADDGANDLDVEGMADVFVYTGGGGQVVPHDVVRVSVHPSVAVIPQRAFCYRIYLEEVELCEGLLEIGEYAFYNCVGLKRIAIPSTVTVIRESAFMKCSQLEEVELCEGLQTIENGTFAYCQVLKRIKIPSTVTTIGNKAFYDCYQLEETELCEGLLTIGEHAFHNCKSLKHINLPTTIRSIGDWAFADAKSLLTINLPDGMGRIGHYAFGQGGLLTLRIPPLITTIPEGMAESAKRLFSVELSESVTQVESDVFASCHSLRNVAFPPNAEIDDEFCHCEDLQQLFGSDERIIYALKHRFDNLPIHKMLYYQSYESVSEYQLNSAVNMRSATSRALRSKLDPTGNQQDSLGMTPLHILACSTVQDIGLYQLLIEKYPENLITEDEWGVLPLLYAVWGNAPSEIVQYLVGMYISIYSEYKFDWTKMVETLGLGNVPKGVIQKLVEVQEDSFPEQVIDWDATLEAVICQSISNSWCNSETFGNIVQLSIARRVGAIGLKQWRDEIMEKVTKEVPGDEEFNLDIEHHSIIERREFITKVESELVRYETKYHNLKEATSLVELALWQQKINDNVQGEEQRRNKKRAKIDNNPSVREQCRFSCGADIVIGHMLPYLFASSK